jgi:hypothetical protein
VRLGESGEWSVVGERGERGASRGERDDENYLIS